MTDSENTPHDVTSPRFCRGVRGATTVAENTREAILEATREMLYIMIRANRRTKKDIKSGMFVALLYAVLDAEEIFDL